MASAKRNVATSVQNSRRHRLRAMGAQTRDIIVSGEYIDETSGRKTHSVSEPIKSAIRSTVVYGINDSSTASPDLEREQGGLDAGSKGAPTIEVTQEKTQAAAYRLRARNIAILNFASAKNPCGGFKTGAQAQEEDLARSSALSACLDRSPIWDAYYEPNRKCGSVLYLNSVVYSRAVPFWRNGTSALCDMFHASVVSAPAPNFGAQKPENRVSSEDFESIYCRRARLVLETLRREGHRSVVLGAWGCGVFRVPPEMAANCFKTLLEGDFLDAFDLVVFAIYEGNTRGTCFETFEKTFVYSQLV